MLDTPNTSEIKVSVRESQDNLINLKVKNPVTYLKIWWKKVMSKEGIDLRFKIHPVTAILITAIIALGSFGIGRASLFTYFPILNKIISTSTPTPSPSDWQNLQLLEL